MEWSLTCQVLHSCASLSDHSRQRCLFALRYKVTYKKETGECRLEISMTFADDAGEYSIYVKNPHGEVSASASLLEEGTQGPSVDNRMRGQ